MMEKNYLHEFNNLFLNGEGRFDNAGIPAIKKIDEFVGGMLNDMEQSGVSLDYNPGLKIWGDIDQLKRELRQLLAEIDGYNKLTTKVEKINEDKVDKISASLTTNNDLFDEMSKVSDVMKSLKRMNMEKIARVLWKAEGESKIDELMKITGIVQSGNYDEIMGINLKR